MPRKQPKLKTAHPVEVVGTRPNAYVNTYGLKVGRSLRFFGSTFGTCVALTSRTGCSSPSFRAAITCASAFLVAHQIPAGTSKKAAAPLTASPSTAMMIVGVLLNGMTNKCGGAYSVPKGTELVGLCHGFPTLRRAIALSRTPLTFLRCSTARTLYLETPPQAREPKARGIMRLPVRL